MNHRSDENSVSTTGRIFAWIAFFGVMLGLTAFYYALDQHEGGIVESVGNGASAFVVLERERSGHYIAQGSINGQTIEFLVDTGATDVAISEKTARAMNLEFGPRIRVMTAAGPISAWVTRLDSVRLGSLERRNVRATISPGLGNAALLGMSFLKHYSLQQEGDRLLIRPPGQEG